MNTIDDKIKIKQLQISVEVDQNKKTICRNNYKKCYYNKKLNRLEKGLNNWGDTPLVPQRKI